MRTLLAAAIDMPHGEAYSRGYAFLPWWVGLSLVGAGLALGVWKWFLPHEASFATWGRSRLSRPRDAMALALFCAVIVAAADGPGFLYGFFRQDDFSFLAVARGPLGLGGQMRLYHNDHLYPLYRLEVWTLARSVGATATVRALSLAFNLVNFITCTGLLVAACWTLHELGASRVVVFAAALMIWTWPGWGEFTAGYYTLSAYAQVQALTFCAAASMLRGFRNVSIGWLACSLLLLTAAIGINISGVIGFGCLFVLAAAARFRDLQPKRLPYLALLTAVFIAICGLYLGVLKHGYSARELVQNPAGRSAGPEMVQQALHHPIAVARTAVSAPGGLVMNAVSPTFLQIFAERGSIGPKRREALIILELLVAVAAAGCAAGCLRRIPPGKRPLALALAACAGLCLALVLIARTSYAVDTPTTLWFAKYMLMPVCWLWVSAAFFADSAFVSPELHRRAPAVIWVTTALGIWLTASCWLWERTLVPASLAYAPRGRWGNVENAQERRMQYEAVVGDLKAIAAASGSRTVCLPDQSLWGSDFYDAHSSLEWGSDVNPKGVTYLFWDLLAASPDVGLGGRWVSEADLVPLQRAALHRCPWIGPGLSRAERSDHPADQADDSKSP